MSKPPKTVPFPDKFIGEVGSFRFVADNVTQGKPEEVVQGKPEPIPPQEKPK